MTKKEELRVNPPKINAPSNYERFMEEFRAEIEKILSDTSDTIPEFSIDAICDKLKIGRAKFFRKVKAITGVTPNEYIMSYRLERASQLLIQNYGNVTHVGLAVGFENPNYFAKCFKEKFDQTPTDYKSSYLESSTGKGQVEKAESVEIVEPKPQIKMKIEFSVEDLDRELVLRLPLPKLEKLFNNKMGTPPLNEIYESIKNFYDSVTPKASNKTLRDKTPKELIQKIQMNIDDLKEDAFKADRYLKSMDIYEIEEEQVNRNALSVAAVCMKEGLIPCGKGFSQLETVNFGETFNLCLSEPFLDQPIGAGPICTGVLVAEDVIATAAHFVNDKNLIDICFVFGFVMQYPDPITPITKVPNENIYKGVEILHRVHNPECDWVLVKLDRKVSGREIATLSKNKVFNEQPVYIIGHPCGLPLKIAPGAYVKDFTDSYFRSDLDIYSSNSGSPVFCAQTHEVIGIVSRSRPADLRWTGNCLISLSYPDNSLNPFRSQCTRATEFIKYV
jgi:AraC-like DNA-binding protein